MFLFITVSPVAIEARVLLRPRPFSGCAADEPQRNSGIDVRRADAIAPVVFRAIECPIGARKGSLRAPIGHSIARKTTGAIASARRTSIPLFLCGSSAAHPEKGLGLSNTRASMATGDTVMKRNIQWLR